MTDKEWSSAMICASDGHIIMAAEVDKILVIITGGDIDGHLKITVSEAGMLVSCLVRAMTVAAHNATLKAAGE